MPVPLVFRCRGCGYEAKAAWTRQRCPGCGRWYDFKQVPARDYDDAGAVLGNIDGEVVSLQDAVTHAIEIPRVETGVDGFDHVLGGGLVPGELVLLCGSPGSGKTLLLLKVFQQLGLRRVKSLYISGEESLDQLAVRAKPLGKFPSRTRILAEESIDRIFEKIREEEPGVVCIDSIQTVLCESGAGDDLEPGSSASVKTAIREFMRLAKEMKIAFIVIGHIRRDGAIGGPQALNHYVDCSLYLEGRAEDTRRLLRCDQKNRFASDVAYPPCAATFEMGSEGLKFVEIADDEVRRKMASRDVKDESDKPEA